MYISKVQEVVAQSSYNSLTFVLRIIGISAKIEKSGSGKNLVGLAGFLPSWTYCLPGKFDISQALNNMLEEEACPLH